MWAAGDRHEGTVCVCVPVHVWSSYQLLTDMSERI